MGGADTAVSLDTRDVYLEAAFWWPDSIRGRARRYNFSTDAAHRFERGVDYATNVDHIEYITRLIIDICGGQAGPVDDQITALPERMPIAMRLERCRRVLGMPIGPEAIASAFGRIGFAFESDAKHSSYASDLPLRLEIEEDLIGEVARLTGYENIPAHPPRRSRRCAPHPRQRSAHAVRTALALAVHRADQLFMRRVQWERNFAPEGEPIAVLNPIAAHLSVMRSTLLGGLVNALSYNLNRKADRVRVFEIGRVYLRDRAAADGPLQVGGVAQPMLVAGLTYGTNDDEQWAVRARDVDFLT